MKILSNNGNSASRKAAAQDLLLFSQRSCAPSFAGPQDDGNNAAEKITAAVKRKAA